MCFRFVLYFDVQFVLSVGSPLSPNPMLGCVLKRSADVVGKFIFNFGFGGKGGGAACSPSELRVSKCCLIMSVNRLRNFSILFLTHPNIKVFVTEKDACTERVGLMATSRSNAPSLPTKLGADSIAKITFKTSERLPPQCYVL
jgi:hypothetical protein